MSKIDANENKMLMLDHLTELRRRLIFCFIGIIVAFGFCYGFSQNIFNFLVEPLAGVTGKGKERRMILNSLHGALLPQVKVAFFG